ncbi:MAG: FG-GAP repeat domain-containing protein [Candidatus Angelobacter sp.]
MKSSSLLHLLASSLVLSLISSFAVGQSFQRTIHHGPPAPDVVAADVNQDRKIDLLTPQTDEEGEGLIFLNHGDGTFPVEGSQPISNIGFPATRVVVADFNGDGITDYVMESCSSGGLSIILFAGDGTGAFNQANGADRHFPPLASSCTNAMSAIIIANDKLPSILVSSLDTFMTIFRNDGTGRFRQQQDVFGAPGAIFTGSSVGDFNGDHRQDIAAISTNPSGGPEQVVIFSQNPDGSFQPPRTVFSLNATLQLTQTVDFNGNQTDDLVVPFFGGPDKRAGVIALTNVGRGKFRSKILLADPFYTLAGQRAAAIHSRARHDESRGRDDDSQGKHDEVRGILAPFSPAPSTGDPVFAFFPARGDTWGKPIYFDVPNGTGAQAVAVADFNGDGRPDFAGVDNNNELLVFLNTTTKDTCAFPNHIGVRICSPDSDSDDTSMTAKIHASANGGSLPIIGMKAFIDDKLVFESDMNTLDASVPVGAGRHVLTVSASDRNGKVYQSRVGLHVR